MSESSKNAVRYITVGVDGSPSSDEALRWAVREAELTGDVVKAVIAWQFPVLLGGYGWAPVVVDDADFSSLAEKVLAESVAKAVRAGSPARVEQHVVEGYPPQVLLDAAAGSDLLVVGSRGHGTFTDALIGSVSQHCAHHAKCPVVIVRGHHDPDEPPSTT
ncbi:MAG TPA: universal stress protein [Streptosporangiaceae bacterium]|nr:universal stress protein [Streptosporangiaceae bacterium]